MVSNIVRQCVSASQTFEANVFVAVQTATASLWRSRNGGRGVANVGTPQTRSEGVPSDLHVNDVISWVLPGPRESRQQREEIKSPTTRVACQRSSVCECVCARKMRSRLSEGLLKWTPTTYNQTSLFHSSTHSTWPPENSCNSDTFNSRSC